VSVSLHEANDVGLLMVPVLGLSIFLWLETIG